MRQIIVLGSVLVVSLGASYYAWTREAVDPKDQDKIAVYRGDAEDVKKLVWKGEDLVVELEKKTDATGDYLWIVSTEQVAKKVEPPSPTDTDAPDAPPAEKETKISTFKGNDTADDVWASFTPLLALRELAPAEGADLSVFGLDAPKGTIEVTRAAGVLTLQVGGETWGSRDRYLGVDGKVFLVDDATLRPLQYAKTRLVDRNLQPLAEADLESVTLAQGPNSETFVQKNREDRAKAFWARGSAGVEDAVAATWLDKLLRLRVQNYVGSDELPASIEPLFTATATGKGETWTMEISKGGDGEFYASSTWNRGLVKLTKSLAAEAVADFGSVMSGSGSAPTEEAPPADEPPAP